MKVDNSLRTVEPLHAIKRHPAAATFGGAITGVLFGVMGATIEGGVIGALMAIIGVIIGAPGGAHIAEAAES